MKLIQAKLRGTGPLIQSSWFQLSGHLNQFHFPTPVQGTTFLRALQTLQPPSCCQATDPFGAFPRYEKKGMHTKHIDGAKRTIALGVFGATAEIATELGLIDDNLYEVDRIEIGRRLDYSRWLNFVELSSSTRWKEIEADVLQLLLPLKQHDAKQYAEAISVTGSLRGADRIKDATADHLLFFLMAAANCQPNSTLHQETAERIRRAAHFQTARKHIWQRLPLLIYCNNQGNIASPMLKKHQAAREHQELFDFIKQEQVGLNAYDNAADIQKPTVLERLREGIRLSLLVSKKARRLDPIFLFDAPEINVPQSDHPQLQQLIKDTAESQQCFYLSAAKDFFSQSDTGKNYSSADFL